MVKDMGMTDGQFKAFVRLLISNLTDADREEEKEKIRERLQRTLEILQSSLED